MTIRVMGVAAVAPGHAASKFPFLVSRHKIVMLRYAYHFIFIRVHGSRNMQIETWVPQGKGLVPKSVSLYINGCKWFIL